MLGIMTIGRIYDLIRLKMTLWYTTSCTSFKNAKHTRTVWNRCPIFFKHRKITRSGFKGELSAKTCRIFSRKWSKIIYKNWKFLNKVFQSFLGCIKSMHYSKIFLKDLRIFLNIFLGKKFFLNIFKVLPWIKKKKKLFSKDFVAGRKSWTYLKFLFKL